MRVLVTGATGYIGGRLIPLLLEQGHEVRVLVRDVRRIGRRDWLHAVEVFTGSLYSHKAVQRAADGMEAAYYLVHSMSAGSDYVQRDRHAALIFADAARGLKHVIYLGGLLPPAGRISRHLASRAEVGKILRGSLPVTEFRAGPIIGSGSASFELLRYLVKRLPLIAGPAGSRNLIQPIGVRNTLQYLVQALYRDPLGIVEIGADRLSFMEMLQEIASAYGYRRLFLCMPVLPPRVAAFGAAMLTPVSKSIAVPLVEGVIHPLVANTAVAEREFPAVELIPYRRAVELALGKEERREVETRFSGALGGGPTYELTDWEDLAREVRSMHVAAPPEAVFRSFCSLGGERGWLVWNWAWRWRGRLDSLLGGPGLRRGRRHPEELLPGEAVDFWRVETVEPPSLLRLRAEMLTPGKAWLQWEALPEGDGTRLVQSALFESQGVWGSLYWYMLYPVHRTIFRDLLRAIARDSRKSAILATRERTV